MKNRSTFFIPLFFFTVLIIGLMLSANSVNAAPPAQGFATSTPGPDGRIIYTVVQGDSCSAVAFKVGITIQQLRQYNTRLDDSCTLTIGQPLIIGLVQPQTGPTPGPSPTTTAPALTVTPFSGTTEVCVLLFNDLNGNALRETNELGVDGGAVSLTNLNGSYSQTLNTAASLDPNTGEPTRACFQDVPAGDYNVSMAVPDGYNPTMLLSYKITVKAGDRASVDFGAQAKTETTVQTTAQPTDTRSSPLGLVGLLLLLGGIGLGYYAYRSNQPKSKLKGSPLDRR
jgi:murein DD-endopeptidase MepM/ murein hydrolase activator NlpD